MGCVCREREERKREREEGRGREGGGKERVREGVRKRDTCESRSNY